MDNGIVLTTDNIVAIAAVLSALFVIFGAVFAVYRWYLRQNKQDEDIKALKKEVSIITVGLLACLKGLAEQGCDGPVTTGISQLEAFIHEQAHQ